MMLVIVDTGMHICLIIMAICAPLAAIGHLADAWLKREERAKLAMVGSSMTKARALPPHDDGQTVRAVYPDGEKQDGLHHCFHCYLNAQKGNWETFRRTTVPNASHYDAASDWSDPECKWYCEVHWQDIQSLRRSLDELYGRQADE